MMKKVLIASKTCRHTLPEKDLCSLFRNEGLEPVLESLEQCSKPNQFDGIVIGTEIMNAAIMDKMSRLRIICKFGVGIDNIDSIAADKRGIIVRNLPGINRESVALMALALMLASARRISVSDRMVRTNQWPRLIATNIVGGTLGIMGTGSIGCTLAAFVNGLDMKLLGWDAVVNPDFIALGGKYVSLPELLNQSDCISLHLPLTEDTMDILDEKEFNSMRSNVTIVNTARGKLINEEALYRFLTKNPGASAGLDVLACEPPEKSPLLKLPNVTITPHIAAYDQQTLEHMVNTCIKILHDYLVPLDNRELS